MAVDAPVSTPPARSAGPEGGRRRSWAVRRATAGNELPVFRHRLLPMSLILPELAVVGIFFLWPSVQAVLEAFQQSNAFGLGAKFSGLANFTAAIHSGYPQAVEVTAGFTAVTTGVSMGLALLLAVQVEHTGRFKTLYRTLFIWSYAVPGAIGATLWLFLFEPRIGPGARLLSAIGVNWNFALNGPQAFALVAALTIWQQTAYNFVFFSAGLQAIPDSVVEAATIDGAGPVARFWKVVFPLLGPTVVFVTVADVLAALFSSFAVIDVITQGGPGNATTTLVYMLYQDGFKNGDVGLAGAESILLFILAGALLVVQFRVFSRRVHYR